MPQIIPSLFITATLLTGCLTQEDGDREGHSSARIEFKALSAKTAATPGAPLTLKDDSGLIFTIAEARVNIRRIRLDSEGGDSCKSANSGVNSLPTRCDLPDLDLTGPFVIDLLTGISTPMPELLSIPAGDYRRLKIRIEDARAEDGLVTENDELNGNSLVVKGTYGSEAKPFHLALNFMEDIEVESSDVMKLNSGAVAKILVSLDISKWMAGLNFDACLKQEKVAVANAKRLTLTDNSELGKCMDVENVLKKNIKYSLHMEKK